MIFNVLHVLDMSVNFLSIKKFLDVDIEVVFYKKNYILIQNNIILIDTRNRDLFFLNLWEGNNILIVYNVFSNLIY